MTIHFINGDTTHITSEEVKELLTQLKEEPAFINIDDKFIIKVSQILYIR